MRHYRRLTIAQAKQALAAGHKLLAADGHVCFRSVVMHAPLNLPCTELHWATFNHLVLKQLIQVNPALSNISGTNQYATWELK